MYFEWEREIIKFCHFGGNTIQEKRSSYHENGHLQITAAVEKVRESGDRESVFET